MRTGGVRRILQPVLYVGLAALAHGLLFLIPGVVGKPESGKTRGVRLRVLGGETRVSPPAARAPSAAPVPPKVTSPPPETVEKTYSSIGGGTQGPGKETTGSPGVEEGGRTGEGGASERSAQGRSGPPVETEFGSYLARLKSEGVQGWAKESASQQRQGWRGTGKAGGLGTAGGPSPGTTGGGKGKNLGAGGTGTGYLDPRVKVVVTSYPPTGIEQRYTQVPYPERKFKKNEFTSGWWNVYLQIRTDATGRVIRKDVLRPETNGPLERIFVEQVKNETDKWSFDRKEAEINVDVRFYVE
ncbi:MAG TPA: hypothetical protein VN450_03650 [Candidatus Methylomirabilis sp.]|nr:hypothetical protein [Candidatus Methylomirabilis sp.]